MKINPITITLSQHEMELVRKTMTQLAQRDSRIGRIAENALDEINAALSRSDRMDAFGRFWNENQHLSFGEAKAGFEQQHRTYQRGERVMVRPDFGAGAPIEVTITGIDEKNGRPLVTYRDAGGMTRWAYTAHVSPA